MRKSRGWHGDIRFFSGYLIRATESKKIEGTKLGLKFIESESAASSRTTKVAAMKIKVPSFWFFFSIFIYLIEMERDMSGRKGSKKERRTAHEASPPASGDHLGEPRSLRIIAHSLSQVQHHQAPLNSSLKKFSSFS